jgi:hypothetical protein
LQLATHRRCVASSANRQSPRAQRVIGWLGTPSTNVH